MNSDARKDGAIVEVEGLRVEFPGAEGPVRAVNGVSFSVPRGKTLGIVGESGCGKSMTLRALIGLVPQPGRIVGGSVSVDGRRIESTKGLEALRGREIAMIFQDPASSLNPVQTVGAQIAEVLRVKLGLSRAAARAEAIRLLDRVRIPDARHRSAAYPHELSGGMRQRVMIAIALACQPRVLLADEPTTALDVTTQEQILRLLLELQDESGLSIVLVTHDLGVVEEVCDEVNVMYAGYVLERGTIDEVAGEPKHPYTKALVAAMPRIEDEGRPAVIAGQPPDLGQLPPGCPFAPRCPEVRPECTALEMEDLTPEKCACPFSEAAVDSHSTVPSARGGRWR
jgi:oligopeptide/dipeptide ABC transporter ATP-binding protein